MRTNFSKLWRAAAKTPLANAAVAAAVFFASTSASAGAPGINEHFAQVHEMKLHYLQAGQGDEVPVILLHGYTETSHMWVPLMQRLSARHVLIAPDLPGAGASDMPIDGYDKKTMAQEIHALVQGLGYRKVKLVGHDIGLMVAYAYAAQYPQEVDRIALMDAFLPGVGDWRNVFLLRDKWHFNFFGETPEQLVAGRERIYFEHFWNDFAAKPHSALSESDRELYAATYARPGRMHAGMAYFKAFDQDAADFAAFAKTPLDIPMLAIGGEKASGTFLIDQARLVDTHVQGLVVEGSGHWLMEEAPQQTMTALTQFLDRASN